MITFNKDIVLEVISGYLEEEDIIDESSEEAFKENESVDADIVCEDEDGNIQIQFGDGSIAFCNRNDLV